MVERLSEIGKWIFCVFRLFLSLCWTASGPYRATSMPLTSINPKDYSLEFFVKSFENWRFWKSQFSLSLDILITICKNFFFLIPLKISQHLYDNKDGHMFDKHSGFQQIPVIVYPCYSPYMKSVIIYNDCHHFSHYI